MMLCHDAMQDEDADVMVLLYREMCVISGRELISHPQLVWVGKSSYLQR